MRRITLLVATASLVLSALASIHPAAAARPTELPIYKVAQEGLTRAQGRNLAEAFHIPIAQAEDGTFDFVGNKLGNVPLQKADGSILPPDEGKMQTETMAFNIPRIRRIRPLGNDVAVRMAMAGLAQAQIALPEGTSLLPSHTMLKLQSLDGRTSFSKPIDTSVGFEFMLGKQHLWGPGAKGGITFDPAGEVTELNLAFRQLERSDSVPLIKPGAANRACVMHYPPGSRLMAPRLIYWAPPLSSHVAAIFPHYQCQGTGPEGEQLVPAVVPAVAGIVPLVKVDALLDGNHVDARAGVDGGTPPYSFAWQSLTTDFGPKKDSEGPIISYDLAPREPVRSEVLWVTVTDANGLIGTAMAELPLGRAVTTTLRQSRPRSVSTLDVGGEFNVYEWQCVKDSVAGFTSVFNSKGIPIQFKWTGTNAWERDYRETGAPQNGDDSSYVDDVDLTWYTGHGNPNEFTFDNTSHDDGSIVPNDGLWGNRDLEWLQLESCNVLQFDSGGTLIWDRWAKTFDGLHLLNGFQTTASCVDYPGGTAGRFSYYLFPESIGPFTIPALKVRQAWAQMARDLEPSGKQYVTMGSAGPGWITNFDDYFWGQGPVGPDIPKSQIIGYWWLMGSV